MLAHHCYTHRRISSVCRMNELERYLRCRGGRAWGIMERKHSAELLGTKQKVALGGGGTVRVKWVRWGRAGG